MRLNSTAVMQRRLESNDSLDDFPTPPWATRALCEYLVAKNFLNSNQICREPAANRGYMVRPLEEYFKEVRASDIEDYNAGFPVKDYLNSHESPVHWTITNPPFTLAKDFILKAFESSEVGVAMILRIAFLEGKKRYEELFDPEKYPPSYVLQFVERVPMVKARYDPEASSATAYAWFIWLAGYTGPTILDWIPPCKKELIRENDVLIH